MFAVNLHPVSDRVSGLLRPPFSIAVLYFLCAFFFYVHFIWQFLPENIIWPTPLEAQCVQSFERE